MIYRKEDLEFVVIVRGGIEKEESDQTEILDFYPRDSENLS